MGKDSSETKNTLGKVGNMTENVNTLNEMYEKYSTEK